MTDARAKFKELFCEEATDKVKVLTEKLLLLERDPANRELYTILMRSAHTIKGSSATMGYSAMARLAHTLEDVFRAGESGVVTLTKDTMSVVLAAVDNIARSLDTIKAEDKELPIDVSDAALRALFVHLSDDAPRQPAATAVQKPATPSVVASAYGAPASVRVSVERLDALMGIFEEMLMLRLKLSTILEPASDIAKSITDPVLKQKLFFIQEFEALFGEFARLLSEMQSELLRVRLVPLDQIFGQFPRMIRDLALQEQKQITFHVEGESVELDRTVLEGLGGALAHLLRNAVDHGIVREGKIVLRAERSNDRVKVIVEDNGAGIRYEEVRKVAIARNVVTPENGALLRNTELVELLFHPNMSTNSEVTDVSGRGVGLSAVRAFVQDVGGRIEVRSPVSDGVGAQFLLDLPVSLATVKVLIVQSSNFTFAIPFANIVRTFVLVPEAIVRSAHQDTLIIDGKPVPLFWLNRMLGITFGETFGKSDAAASLRVVLISVEQGKVGLVVDSCVGEQELLVKSLPPVLRGIKGFSGSTLLPDGRTILLIDVYGLLLRAFDDILEDITVPVPYETPAH